MQDNKVKGIPFYPPFVSLLYSSFLVLYFLKAPLNSSSKNYASQRCDHHSAAKTSHDITKESHSVTASCTDISLLSSYVYKLSARHVEYTKICKELKNVACDILNFFISP